MEKREPTTLLELMRQQRADSPTKKELQRMQALLDEQITPWDDVEEHSKSQAINKLEL